MKDIIKNIRTARKMPPTILIECVTRLAKRWIRRYAIKFHPVKLSDKDFLNATGYKTIDDFFLIGINPHFSFILKTKKRIIETISNEYTDSIEETLNDADEIYDHIFDLLGSGKTELGKEIDWHLDFKSGFRWRPDGTLLVKDIQSHRGIYNLNFDQI